MFKCAGTFQVSFTAVNVFLLSAPDFGVFVWELLTPVNPSLRRDDVNRHLQLKISALCVCLMYLCLLLPLTLGALSCTSAYRYHWHCFNLLVVQALEIDSFFKNILSRCCFASWQPFTYLRSHPKLVNESVNSSTLPNITNSWILSFVFAVVFKHAVHFPTMYVNLYCAFQQHCIQLWMF